MDDEVAPSCPVSYSQEPSNPRGTAAVRLPSIPIATDLPSLIRAVNIIRDILRSLTTSLTVNNTYYGKSTPSKQYAKKDYLMSDYDSDWYQVGIDNKEGVIYHKTKTAVDQKQKVYVERMDAVEFRNNARDNDQSFFWRYPKKLDANDSGSPAYEEDFFERIVNVKWKKTTPPSWSVDWFYRVEVIGRGANQIDPFCEPWDKIPDNTGGVIYGEDATGEWKDPTPVGKVFIPPDIVVVGKPHGSGAGSAKPFAICHPAGPGNRSVEGTSLDIMILGIPLLEFKCWGSHSYPPPSLAAYWSAMCRVSIRNAGTYSLFGGTNEGIKDFVQIGGVTVHATGISAYMKKDGKPLQVKKTTITFAQSAYGGNVRVQFIDPDNPPDS